MEQIQFICTLHCVHNEKREKKNEYKKNIFSFFNMYAIFFFVRKAVAFTFVSWFFLVSVPYFFLILFLVFDLLIKRKELKTILLCNAAKWKSICFCLTELLELNFSSFFFPFLLPLFGLYKQLPREKQNLNFLIKFKMMVKNKEFSKIRWFAINLLSVIVVFCSNLIWAISLDFV